MPSLDALATRSGYSRFHFLRMFRDHTGVTPRSYAEGVRARRLQSALAGGARVVDAVAEAGFGSESRVYEKTGALLGMTPGAARRGGEGEVIRTAFADCPFGRLLIGATDKGVCFLGFAEPDDALMGDLRRRFPRARIATDNAGLRQTVDAVLGFLAEPKQALDLPLDLRGTVFQQRVWRTLCQIPPGETRTYGELAAHDGQSEGGPGGGAVLRGQPGVARGALPSRDRPGRRADRLSLGRAAEEGVAGAGARGRRSGLRRRRPQSAAAVRARAPERHGTAEAGAEHPPPARGVRRNNPAPRCSPRLAAAANCSSVSTPSAVVAMPSAVPRPVTARTIAAASSSCARSRMNDWSILILSNGKLRR